MTTEEKIEVMQAHVDGAEIEYQTRGSKSGWTLTNIIGWNWAERDYRVKVKPKVLNHYVSTEGHVVQVAHGSVADMNLAISSHVFLKSETL